jgi:high-affinity iron transporter
MLASAIVVFREVLEAALIVGIVMAATVGLPQRNFWVLAGIFGGLAGSIVVAGFADAIAAAASGMGQEYLNATVLFVAVAVLGWSIVWMRRHGRALSRHAKDVGRGVAAGGVPAHMLAVVIGLSVLREGAEAVLFLYGIAAGQSTSASLMLLGGAIGVAAGIAAGYLIYRGLVKIAAHHLFGVTSWLLALLAAGMASQGAAMLVAAGTLPPIVATAWDTSALLSERNILGQVLHTLIGYDSNPALVQVLFYVATLSVITVMMRLADRRPVLPGAGAGAVAAVILASLAVPADVQAGTKVYSPIVHEGEFAFEARGDAAVDRGDTTKKTQTQIYEIEYGVTDRWQTAIFGELRKDAGGPLRYNATAWENILQLFEQGDAWVDSGLYLEYKVANQKDAADKVEGNSC